MTPPYQPTDDFWKWEFEIAGRSPHSWHVQAADLVRSADLLYERSQAARKLAASIYRRDNATGLPVNEGRALATQEVKLLGDRELGRVALMLLAFAIENECKSILVSKRPELIAGDSKLPQGLLTHDLQTLLRTCGIAFTELEGAVLARLSEYSSWAGRYPLPSEAIKSSSRSGVPGGWVKQRLGSVDELWRIGREIFARLG
jgi:hypothetical protein